MVARPRVNGPVVEVLTLWPGRTLEGVAAEERLDPGREQGACRHVGGGVTPPFGACCRAHLVAPWKPPHATWRCRFAAGLVGSDRGKPLTLRIIVTIIIFVVLVRGVLLRLPPCLDLARRSSSACRSRFFFFSFFFSASFTDLCFSAEARLFSRSASSSFTGGLEDRASIAPGKIGMNLRKIEKQRDKQQSSSNDNSRDLPDRSSLPQASWGSRSPVPAESRQRRPP